jgi:hypothetical protein
LELPQLLNLKFLVFRFFLWAAFSIYLKLLQEYNLRLNFILFWNASLCFLSFLHVINLRFKF